MGIRVLSRIAISCLGFGIAALSSGPASADYRQLQAVLAKYFIANHQAIPLHNNGKVKSGDVLKLPEEATYLSRDKCFDLPSVRYTSLDADLLVTTSEVAAEVGGEIPTDKLAKIEATVHGEIRQTAGIRLNPFAQEEPPNGYADLQVPKRIPDCTIIIEIKSSKVQDKILVTRVFHGSVNAIATLDVSGGGKIEAAIEQKQINDILGGKPEVHLAVTGLSLVMQYAKSPEPQSLAVQSAFVNPKQLARIYLAYHTQQRGIALELLVYEYITGSEPGVLDRIRIAISSLLQEMEVRQSSPAALSSSVLSGEGSVPMAKVYIPQEQWRAFATVAAAHEIVAER